MSHEKPSKLHGKLSNNPYPTKRLNQVVEREMLAVSRKTGLSVPAIKRLSAAAGLPIVRSRLTGEPAPQPSPEGIV
jgi:hypothetical protein